MRVRGNTYHVDCFCCVVCARQLTRGEEFSLRGDDLFCKVSKKLGFIVQKQRIIFSKTPTTFLGRPRIVRHKTAPPLQLKLLRQLDHFLDLLTDAPDAGDA